MWWVGPIFVPNQARTLKRQYRLRYFGFVCTVTARFLHIYVSNYTWQKHEDGFQIYQKVVWTWNSGILSNVRHNERMTQHRISRTRFCHAFQVCDFAVTIERLSQLNIHIFKRSCIVCSQELRSESESLINTLVGVPNRQESNQNF